MLIKRDIVMFGDVLQIRVHSKKQRLQNSQRKNYTHQKEIVLCSLYLLYTLCEIKAL